MQANQPFRMPESWFAPVVTTLKLRQRKQLTLQVIHGIDELCEIKGL